MRLWGEEVTWSQQKYVNQANSSYFIEIYILLDKILFRYRFYLKQKLSGYMTFFCTGI